MVIDRHSLRRLGAITVGQGPDGILYDAFSGRIFAFNARSADATAIDIATGRVAGAVALGGKPESASSDARGQIFVNIEDRSAVVVFGSTTLRVQRRWSLAPCSEPAGMAIDSAHERIFSGCRNSLLAVSDTRAGKVVATVPIGAGVDANRFDAADGLILSSNGISGTLTVIRELAPDRYAVAQNVPTMRGARTMDLDPGSLRVYLVGARLRPVAPTQDQPHPRPAVVPGTFRLLILGR